MDNGGRIIITEEIQLSVQRFSELQITSFSLSDAGVYQCIFTEGADVIATTLLRLDAGYSVHSLDTLMSAYNQ